MSRRPQTCFWKPVMIGGEKHFMMRTIFSMEDVSQVAIINAQIVQNVQKIVRVLIAEIY